MPSPAPSPVLSGKRILVVEDELLVAMMIEDILLEQNCSVIGPFSNLTDALAAAQTASFDAAVLDVNLHGQKSYPVGEILAARKIPFFLLSGYGEAALPEDHPEWRTCNKPFTAAELIQALAEQLGGP
jgi:CheY-like chemotaxis protein